MKKFFFAGLLLVVGCLSSKKKEAQRSLPPSKRSWLLESTTPQQDTLTKIAVARDQLFQRQSKKFGDKFGPLIKRSFALQNAFQSGKSLEDVFILGTHNSYNSTQYGIPSITAEQSYSLTEQLNFGVRFLMLDSLDCGGELYAAHKLCLPGFKGEEFSKTIHEISEWHKANPSEFLLIALENGNSKDYDKKLVKIIKDEFGKRIYYPRSMIRLPEVEHLEGRVLFLLKFFREKEEENDVLDIFFKYTSPEIKSGFVFYPQFPANKIKNFRSSPLPISEIEQAKQNGMLVMYEGTNLFKWVMNGGQQYLPQDLLLTLYSGVSVASLDGIDDETDAIKKLYFSLWLFEPAELEKNIRSTAQACTVLSTETGFLHFKSCLEMSRVACFDESTGKWVAPSETTPLSEAFSLCQKFSLTYRPVKSPADMFLLLSSVQGIPEIGIESLVPLELFEKHR